MNEKLAYFVALGAALIIGLVLGRMLAKFAHIGLCRGVALAGAILAFVGLVWADEDRGFRILAIVGIFLQVAGYVATFRRERKV